MSASRDYVAIDLGATSGRVVVGTMRDDRVELREAHRFTNTPAQHKGHLHWNWPYLREQIGKGLAASVATSRAICSVGCDSWGLDHGFLDEAGNLLELPFCYQDSRTDGILDEIASVIAPDALYERAAAPVVGISTLGQLLVTKRQRPDLLEKADRLLFIPGLVHHYLTGIAASEFCGACSSGLCSWRTRNWDTELLRTFELPANLFPSLHSTGDTLGTLRTDLAQSLHAARWDVCQPSGHDTALAVAAAPLEPGDMVISSGTWAMLGIVVDKPRVDAVAFETGGGTYGVPGNEWVFMRGIMGLWLLERLRREEALPDAATVEQMAQAGKPLTCPFAPDDDRLLRGNTFRDALAEILQARRAEIPSNIETLVRSILENLALFVDRTLRQLQTTTGTVVRRIVIVGGGSYNNLLNQFTADATGLPVITGSPEATALGNVLVQAKGRGDLADWTQLREVAARSFPRRQYEPADTARWEEARASFARISEDPRCH